MVMDHGIIIFTPIFAVMIGFTVLRILKKRKRSAKSIYKLIDDLEKINQTIYQLLLLNLSPNLEYVVLPNGLCYQYQLHLHNS